jgi:PST family polysaccharide transporter
VGAFVAGVQGAKAALALLATLLALACWPLVPAFREDPTLLLLGVLLMLSGAFHPLWYFVGVERLKLLGASDVAIRLASAAAILLLVREADDGELVLLIWIAGAALSTTVLTGVMYGEVPLRRPALDRARQALRGGAALFVSTASVSLYTSAVVFLLGVVLASAQVAFFAAAERIVRVAIRILSQVGGATFPRINYLLGQGREDRANQLALLTLAILCGIGVAAAAVLVALAPFIIRIFYGDDFEPAIAVLRILALVVPLSVVAGTLGTQWLLTRHLDRPATLLVLVVGGLTALTVLVAAPAVGIEGAAWILVVAEAAVVLGNVALIRRARIALPRTGASRSPA